MTIDTKEFRNLLWKFVDWQDDDTSQALIDHIDAHIETQLAAALGRMCADSSTHAVDNDAIASMRAAITRLEDEMGQLRQQIKSLQTRPSVRKLDSHLRLPAVIERVGLKKTTIYQYIKEGSFPAPIQLGGRAVAWVEEEITKWQKDRIAGVPLK